MTFWGIDLDSKSSHPKQKSRFIVELGNGGWMLSLSSITKPAVTIEKKEYRMINHYYNYPGIPKWEPITMTFVDNQIWGTSIVESPGPTGATMANTKSTSGQLFEMLLATGYTTPSKLRTADNTVEPVVSPEKASTIENSFGTNFHNLSISTRRNRRNRKCQFHREVDTSQSNHNKNFMGRP